MAKNIKASSKGRMTNSSNHNQKISIDSDNAKY